MNLGENFNVRSGETITGATETGRQDDSKVESNGKLQLYYFQVPAW